MGKKIKHIILFLILFLLVFSSMAVAEDMTMFSSVEGKIVVKGQMAVVNINGTDYMISKENRAYVQFEGRYIRMYKVRINSLKYCIEFTGFRFIDAYV